jgi:hypothetical protein
MRLALSPTVFLSLLPLVLTFGAATSPAAETVAPAGYDLSRWPAELRAEVAAITDAKFNDTTRPLPPPADAPARLAPLPPPPGAIVLFAGGDLSAWEPSRWITAEDYVEITPGTGDLFSRAAFGSCRLHLQWWTPPGPGLKKGQDRGNSGVFFMGRYEVQVLDTYQNPTYPDGMAGAIYGQHPPLKDALHPPGVWQTYLIEFRRPVFSADGSLVRPARFTVDLNGVRVQQDALVIGPTNPPGRRFYSAHPDAQPLRIQNHKELVRFRSIWIEPLAD